MLIILIAFLSGALLGALITALVFDLPPPSHGSTNSAVGLVISGAAIGMGEAPAC
jgi:hypothetical protein